MKSKNDDIKRLKKLEDAVIDEIINSTDEEFVANYINDYGEGPKTIANALRDSITSYGKEKKLNRLKNARKKYDEETSFNNAPIIAISENKLDILKSFFATLNAKSDLALVAFRDYNPSEMSEEDVSSLLEDLIELGYITEEMLKNE